jgi:hypothetical protein
MAVLPNSPRTSCIHEFSAHGLRLALNPETSNVCFDECGYFCSESLSKTAHLPSSIDPVSRFVVWTTDSDDVGVRLRSRFGTHAMSDSNVQRDDYKRQLELLRLASDLRQLATETLAPDLKEHCLRMAKQWSDEADEPAKDDARVDKGLG